MPKISVYLPDALYREARNRGLPISALAQQAIEEALGRDDTQRWVDRVHARPRRVHQRIDTTTLLDQVRDEFGA